MSIINNIRKLLRLDARTVSIDKTFTNEAGFYLEVRNGVIKEVGFNNGEGCVFHSESNPIPQNSHLDNHPDFHPVLPRDTPQDLHPIHMPHSPQDLHF